MPAWISQALKLFIKYGPLAWEAFKVGRKIVKEAIMPRQTPKQVIQEYKREKEQKKSSSDLQA